MPVLFAKFAAGRTTPEAHILLFTSNNLWIKDYFDQVSSVTVQEAQRLQYLVCFIGIS